MRKRDKQLFKTLWLEGVLYVDIIRMLKIGYGTAFNWRKELNLPRRKRGPKPSIRKKRGADGSNEITGRGTQTPRSSKFGDR